MTTKKEIKRHIIKIGILLVSVVLLGTSLSYAYFTANISGRVEIEETTAARLDITSDLPESTTINNSQLQLIDQAEKETKSEKVEFSVTNANTSTVNGQYFIYLTDIKLTKNLYSKYFKWELAKKEDNGETILSNGTFVDAERSDEPAADENNNVKTTAEEILLNSTGIRIPINHSDNLVFRIWVENDTEVNQISLTNGSFQGRLRLEASPTK